MKPSRILAVDPGGRRCGLALAAGDSTFATPIDVIPYEGCRAAAETIRRIADDHGATTVVIGLPTTVNGEETPACRRSRALGDQLTGLGLDVHFQAEYLSSREARDRARELGRSRNLPVDDIAAQVILEDFLACRPGSVSGRC